MNKETLLKLVSIWKLENAMTKNMGDLGFEGQITFSDATRELRRNPEIVKQMDELIKKLEEVNI